MRNPLSGLALVICGLIVAPGSTWAIESGDQNSATANPRLTQFIQANVAVNPRVLAAQAALRASGAKRSAAGRPLYNPELTLEAENSDTETRAVGLSQTLDWGGKGKARRAVADADRLVVEAEYLMIRWQVTVDLLGGLAQYQTDLERDRLSAKRRQLMDEFAALARRRFAAGDLSQVELNLALLESTTAHIQKARAGIELAGARQAVRNIAPRSMQAEWPKLPVELPALPHEATNLQAFVKALPEVVSARRQIDRADAVVELRRRQQRMDPTVSLVGGKEEGESLVGLTLSIPLFVRNNFSFETDAALAELNQTQQLADDVMQRAYARLVGAKERYQLSHQAWIEWQQTGQASLSKQNQQLGKLWQAGDLSTTGYLVQLRQTLDVQESVLELREALWRAWFDWLWASGQVDVWLTQGVSK